MLQAPGRVLTRVCVVWAIVRYVYVQGPVVKFKARLVLMLGYSFKS